jgi:PHP family Zn ribbon phosphoesterase
MWFLNRYTCSRCDTSWSDEWSATCDDECPQCGTDISPRDSDDLTIVVAEEGARFVVLHSPDTAEHDPEYQHLADFPSRAEAEAYAKRTAELA